MCAYRYEKETNGDVAIVVDGWEKGIAPSPHAGIANMQAVDLNTELKEAMVSYSRTLQTSPKITSGGTLSVASSTVLFVGGGVTPLAGSWVTVSGSTITGLANGTYYVIGNNGNQSGQVQLSNAYSTSSGDILSGYSGGGSANFISAFDLSTPVAGATERYVDPTGVTQYRYYVFDTNGRLFVQDTFTLSGIDTPKWALPYTSTITSYNGSTTSTACGMTVMNGCVFLFAGNKVFTVSTSQLGSVPQALSAGSLLSQAATTNPHYAFPGHQGRLYYTDGKFVGSIFPDTSVDSDLVTPIGNVQSYGSYTAASTTGTITAILNGSFPTEETSGTPSRIPAFFFAAFGGTKPAAITLGTKYYIQYLPGSFGTFEVYAAQTGGSAINIASGASGVQYFNTFFPQSSDGNKTLVFSPERLILPSNEIATTIAELGNAIIVGTQSNALYPWNQIGTLPNDLLQLPETNTASMVTVNNVVYVFAGTRGNIYITNGSSISLATSVPDYCSGLIEPYFTWGGSMFLRGRVYFSIQDQTSTHTGNCGGVWSFIPVQNFSFGQDYGIAMRMDNKNSYNTFNGLVPVLIPNQNQSARGPQYFSAWYSSISSPLFGIDASDIGTFTPAVIQTDIIPTGTLLNKKSFKQVEYKLAAPLISIANDIESVTMAYRTNLSDAFTSLGTVVVESATGLSGYFVANFQNTQWLQLQITLTPTNNTLATTFSFMRLFEIRIR